MKPTSSPRQLIIALRSVLCALFLLAICSLLPALSQIPQGFNYQAIAKDGSGIPIAGQTIPVRISIQSDSLGGTVFWVELHSNVTTSSSGLFTLVVGKGVKQSGTAATFSAINWSVWPKYIMTEVDYGGWKTLGSSKMWSVPYAMVSTTSDTWSASGADVFRATGNVGIGKTNPVYKLDVDGSIQTTGIVISNYGIQSGLNIYKSDNPSDQKFTEFLASGTNGEFVGRFVNDAYTQADYWLSVSRNTGTYTVKNVTFPSGNVGIGTTNPTFKFQVTGGESLFGYNGGNGSLRFTTGYNNSFIFKPLDHALQIQTDHTGNPVIMYLDKSGPIGIGNANPAYIICLLYTSEAETVRICELGASI